MACMDVDFHVTPRKKLLRLFLGGRENWKKKLAMVNYEKKLAANQSRAVERSRDKWRALALEPMQHSSGVEVCQ
jgi:hypothetical protein